MMFTTKKEGRSLLLLLLVMCCSLPAATYGQAGAAPDTAFVREAVATAIGSYRQSVGVHAHLYSGQAYVDYRRMNREGHQFFTSDEAAPGSILFDAAWYPEVPLLYDIVRDEVVIQMMNSAVRQKLVSQKITRFQVHGHTFVRLHQDSLAAAMKPGFYDLLYSNNITLLAKRTKRIEEEHDVNQLKQKFPETNHYYILKDKQYFQVKHKRSVYQVLKERKKELRKFARERKLKFRNNKEEAFLALVKHYDSLSE